MPPSLDGDPASAGRPLVLLDAGVQPSGRGFKLLFTALRDDHVARFGTAHGQPAGFRIRPSCDSQSHAVVGRRGCGGCYGSTRRGCHGPRFGTGSRFNGRGSRPIRCRRKDLAGSDWGLFRSRHCFSHARRHNRRNLWRHWSRHSSSRRMRSRRYHHRSLSHGLRRRRRRGMCYVPVP